MIEEFAEGDEFSVECISYEGKHTLLAITRKFNTGSPSFIEKGHLEPAFPDDKETERKIQDVVFHALDSLEVRYGASHTELKVDSNGVIRLIETGARMGGDMIGSSLVQLSTGVDFVKAVIDIALGEEPEIDRGTPKTVAIRYIFNNSDIDTFRKIEQEHPEYIVEATDISIPDSKIIDSSSRCGYYILCGDDHDKILSYMK